MGRYKYGPWLDHFAQRKDAPPGGWAHYLKVWNRGERLRRYRRYLQSSAWSQRRNAVLAREGQCQLCGRTNRLEVHHVHYLRVGCEHIEDLRCLCHDCHKEVEASGDRWVPISPALRMEMERRHREVKEPPKKATRRRPAGGGLDK
jgi:hypothetical protein